MLLPGNFLAVSMNVNEVAAMAIGAETFIEIAETGFCFVGSIGDCIASEFFGSVGELALLSVWTEPVKHKIFAERTFYLGFFAGGMWDC